MTNSDQDKIKTQVSVIFIWSSERSEFQLITIYGEVYNHRDSSNIDEYSMFRKVRPKLNDNCFYLICWMTIMSPCRWLRLCLSQNSRRWSEPSQELTCRLESKLTVKTVQYEARKSTWRRKEEMDQQTEHLRRLDVQDNNKVEAVRRALQAMSSCRHPEGLEGAQGGSRQSLGGWRCRNLSARTENLSLRTMWTWTQTQHLFLREMTGQIRSGLQPGDPNRTESKNLTFRVCSCLTSCWELIGRTLWLVFIRLQMILQYKSSKHMKRKSGFSLSFCELPVGITHEVSRVASRFAHCARWWEDGKRENCSDPNETSGCGVCVVQTWKGRKKRGNHEVEDTRKGQKSFFCSSDPGTSSQSSRFIFFRSPILMFWAFFWWHSRQQWSHTTFLRPLFHWPGFINFTSSGPSTGAVFRGPMPLAKSIFDMWDGSRRQAS